MTTTIWKSPLTIHATVPYGEYLVDVEIAELNPGDIAQGATPEVAAIRSITRADSDDLGTQHLKLDLDALARLAVINAASMTMTENEDGIYGPVSFDAAQAIRELAAGSKGLKWRLIDHWLMSVWKHFRETGHGTQRDIARSLGVDVETVSKRLGYLRKRFGVDRVPLGKAGRPPKAGTE